MDVKIGVQYSPREIVIDSPLGAEEVEAQVAAAIADGGLLSLTDEKGRKVYIPGEKISYVEIAPAEVRRVGFSS